LTRSYKVDLETNIDELLTVQQGLTEQGFTLSTVRILDLYTWAYAGEKPPPWAAQAAERLISRPGSVPEDAEAPGATGIDEGEELAADLGIELDDAEVSLRILRVAAGEVGYVQARREIARWLDAS